MSQISKVINHISQLLESRIQVINIASLQIVSRSDLFFISIFAIAAVWHVAGRTHYRTVHCRTVPSYRGSVLVLLAPALVHE